MPNFRLKYHPPSTLNYPAPNKIKRALTFCARQSRSKKVFVHNIALDFSAVGDN